MLARLVRALPAAPGLAGAERLARAWARLPGAAVRPPFREGRGLAARLERLAGPSALVTCPRLHEDWLVLKLLNWLDELRPLTLDTATHGPGLVGEAHLGEALRGGRGVVLVTAHVGFPPMIRPVLRARGVAPVAVRTLESWIEGANVGDDVWTRARAMRRLDEALSRGNACVVLPDGHLGASVEVPLLRGTIAVGIGAFALALRHRCPLLPYFVVQEHGGGPFRLDVLPPLEGTGAADGDVLRSLARAFAAELGHYIRRYPCHVYGLDALAPAGPPG